MAEIFLARRKGPDGFAKRVALKRALPELAKQEGFREMFADEARLSSSLSHPGLVQVFDYGEHEGIPFLVMEWVEGCDLAAVLDLGEPLPPGTAAYVIAEIARAASALHTARDDAGRPLQAVHRDLAPGNVLVGLDGDLKLADFGVAKAKGRATRTEAGQLKGTLAYLAPEQVSGGAVDARTDVYALGLVLFELLTGERYLRGALDIELLDAAARPECRQPSEHVDGLPAGFDRVIERALACEIERRYPSAAALEVDVGALCQDVAAARKDLATRVARVTGDAPPRRQTAMLEQSRWSVGPTRWLLIALGVALVAGLSFSFFWSARRRAAPVASVEEGERDADRAPPPAVSPPPDAGGSSSGDSGQVSADEPSDGGVVGDAAIRRLAERPRAERRQDRGAAPPADRAEESPPAPVEGADAPVVAAGPAVAEAHARAVARMGQRGLARGDDAETDRLRETARACSSAPEPSPGCGAAIEAFRARIDEVVIDRAFVDRKMRRLSRRLEARDTDEDLGAELRALSQRAARRALAGDYGEANQIMNRILARLRD